MFDPTALSQLLPQQPRARRAQLIEEMSGLEGIGHHCFSCTGVCCTFVANSMQTTPLETAELLLYLREEDRLDDALIARLRACIRSYRLDQPAPGDGRRSFSRRTYTCPFFGDSPKGCSISRSVKPYGCLGFNPQASDITEGGNCASNQDLLQQREDQYQEQEQSLNQRLSDHFKLDWEKKPMPVALLELLACLTSSEP